MLAIMGSNEEIVVRAEIAMTRFRPGVNHISFLFISELTVAYLGLFLHAGVEIIKLCLSQHGLLYRHVCRAEVSVTGGAHSVGCSTDPGLLSSIRSREPSPLSPHHPPLPPLHILGTRWARTGAQTRPALGANTQGCSQSYSQLGREITQTLIIIRPTCDEKEKFLQINFVMT